MMGELDAEDMEEMEKQNIFPNIKHETVRKYKRVRVDFLDWDKLSRKKHVIEQKIRVGMGGKIKKCKEWICDTTA